MAESLTPELCAAHPAAPRSSAAARRRVRIVAALVVASGVMLSGCAQATDGAPTATAPTAAAPSAAAPSAAAPSPGAPSAGPASTEGPATAAPAAAPGTTAAPSPATSPVGTPAAPPPADPASTTLKLGASGPAVTALQQRLSDMGYWLGQPDGNYGQLTRQAVMAFQKAEGLTRDGVAGPQTQQHLPAATRPTPRDTSSDHLEIDLDRQLLFVVRGGQLQWIFNTSTGSGEAYDRPSGGSGVAHTPKGNFTIQRQINGLRRAELGDLYRPKYFRGGIAVHGSGSIPARPASHGCVRVTNSAMDLLWSSGVANIGTPVVVY